MADFEFYIRHISDRNGYRIVRGRESEQFSPNPVVLPGQTVVWHSPEKDACIAFLTESPFTRRGERVVNEVIEVPSGGKSEEFQIAKDVKQGEIYEYAVLIRESDRDYTYVRGAASPPGVAVGP